jgi:hypothetical protein
VFGVQIIKKTMGNRFGKGGCGNDKESKVSVANLIVLEGVTCLVLGVVVLFN